jgi:hypothetical protein
VAIATGMSALELGSTSPRGLRVALWLDEPFAPVDADGRGSGAQGGAHA